jgi:hypothetical protein
MATKKRKSSYSNESRLVARVVNLVNGQPVKRRCLPNSTRLKVGDTADAYEETTA